jgi:hypothetical protein
MTEPISAPSTPTPVELVLVNDTEHFGEDKYPTSAPSRPSTVETTHDFQPLIAWKASLGMSARAMAPTYEAES